MNFPMTDFRISKKKCKYFTCTFIDGKKIIEIYSLTQKQYFPNIHKMKIL